jgi:hypothetical protein
MWGLFKWFLFLFSFSIPSSLNERETHILPFGSRSPPAPDLKSELKTLTSP